nr:MAG TPA: hypothetical protein [Caudoviricetes sp.]
MRGLLSLSISFWLMYITTQPRIHRLQTAYIDLLN